jgi:superfamily II DNA or RNA helicase
MADLLTSTASIATPELRDYQHHVLGWLRDSYRTGHKAPLLCMPTAAGKTVVFAECTRLAALRNTRTLILVHRAELLAQAVRKLRDVGIEPGIVAAGVKPTPDATVQVGTVQTAVRRDLGQYGLAIFDEAHHGVAPTWREIIEALPDTRLMGCTATPARLDGKGLGVHAGGIFDDLIVGATVRELTEAGWLCPAKVYVAATRLDLRAVHVTAGDYNKGELADAVMAADISGDAVAEYRKHAAGQPAIAFCVTISHAEHTAAQFQINGYRAAAIHGKLPRPERDRLLAGLASGEIEILTSCEILGEGIDIPTIGAAILLRPTRSLAVYLQQVGRGLRPAPGKPHLTVLDLAGNAIEHGLPDEEREWSLDAAPKRKPRKLIIAADGEAQIQRELLIDKTAQLVELSQARLDRILRMSYGRFIGHRRSDAEIAAYRRHRGYKPGWDYYAKQMMAEREGVA